MVTSTFRRSRAANSVVNGGIWSKFKLIQALMHVLISCNYEKDPIKNSGENVITHFPHYKSMGSFSGAKGQLTP